MPPAAGVYSRAEYNIAKQISSEDVGGWHARLRDLYNRAYPGKEVDHNLPLIEKFVTQLINKEVGKFPENNRIMEREGIRVVAARRPLGIHIKSPPPPYDSGEEHHGLQQGASRASSPDVDEWFSAWEDRQQSPSTTRRNRVQSRRNKDAGEAAAANSPYSSAAHQLVQAREMLALQKRDAAETLDNVHGYYERRMQPPPGLERPSATDARSCRGPVRR
jgi:hypothetical protein